MNLRLQKLKPSGITTSPDRKSDWHLTFSDTFDYLQLFVVVTGIWLSWQHELSCITKCLCIWLWWHGSRLPFQPSKWQTWILFYSLKCPAALDALCLRPCSTRARRRTACWLTARPLSGDTKLHTRLYVSLLCESCLLLRTALHRT